MSTMEYCLKRTDRTIFIVDDDTSLCRALARLLKSAGYIDVRKFSSAEDFLHSATETNRPLLILDLQLPGMSGIDLLRHLKRSGRSIPAILISAHDEGLILAKSAMSGARAFLHKPFEEAELLSAIGSIASE